MNAHHARESSGAVRVPLCSGPQWPNTGRFREPILGSCAAAASDIAAMQLTAASFDNSRVIA